MRRAHLIVAGTVLIAGASASAPPYSGKIGLPKPSLLRSYTEQLYSMPQGTFVAQFNPAKGQLRSVSAKLGGLVRYKVTLAGPPGANTGYAFTAYAPAYVFGANAWFDLKASGSGQFSNDPVQEISGQASGGGAVSGASSAATEIFSGGSTVRLQLSPDLPQFSQGKAAIKSVEVAQSSLDGSVTYTYLPTIGKILKPLPK